MCISKTYIYTYTLLLTLSFFRTPLPDIIHSFVPQQAWSLRVGDFMVTMCSLSVITIFFFHKHRHVVMRRTFFIAGILYTLRTLSTLCTQLPPGYSDNVNRCRRQLTITERTWKVYLSRLLEQIFNIGFQVSFVVDKLDVKWNLSYSN